VRKFTWSNCRSGQWSHKLTLDLGFRPLEYRRELCEGAQRPLQGAGQEQGAGSDNGSAFSDGRVSQSIQDDLFEAPRRGRPLDFQANFPWDSVSAAASLFHYRGHRDANHCPRP
jgi:hypothetical protein